VKYLLCLECDAVSNGKFVRTLLKIVYLPGKLVQKG
jgi:hypothetical protein